VKAFKRTHLPGTLAAAIAVALLAGCGSKDDKASQAKKSDANTPQKKTDTDASTTKPEAKSASVVDAKAIAEEAFIYGFPMVMNYGQMNELLTCERNHSC
jgi:hypothetical protein